MDESNSVKFSNLNHTATNRPTEGQLKWALLNHKRVAAKVRQYVERLYMLPQSTSDIPAYQLTNRHPHHVDDDEDVSNFMASKHSTIHASEGRRALLYHSNLEYENRKRCISVNGFRFHRSTSDDDESDQSTNGDAWISGTFQPNRQMISSHNNNISNCMPSTGRRKKFRRRRQKFQPRCSDPERVRRFKEAFQVALNSLELASGVHSTDGQQTSMSEPNVVASSPILKSRKWKRPEINDEFIYPADSYTVYGCSTIPKRQPSVHNPTLTPGKAPLDRGATWLNLFPASQSKKVDGRTTQINTPINTLVNDDKDRYCTGNNSNHRSLLTPALRQHVADVAREIFSGERKGKSNVLDQMTTTSESPLDYNLDTLERDITSFVDQFEEHLLLASDSIDDDDSVTSSPRHPKYDMVVPMIGRRIDDGISSSSIVPVVTYDSDESKHNNNNNMAWNESTISKNLDETFTLQELDSSFQCWNVATTGTSSPIMADEDGCRIESDNATRIDHLNDTESETCDEINVAMNVAPPNMLSPYANDIPDLLLSPLTWKQYLRRLPDNDEIIDVVLSSNSKASVSDSVVDTHVESTTAIPIEIIDNIVVPITNETRNATLKPKNSTQPRELTKYGSERNKNDSDPVVVHHWLCDDRYSFDRTTSAGCGLYTERCNHYDVTWERRLRL